MIGIGDPLKNRESTRGIIYIGTYLERDMAGLRRLLREPMMEEIVFLFDGRGKDGTIDEPDEALVDNLIKAEESEEEEKPPSLKEEYYNRCISWARGNYADSWALASRKNLCMALKRFGPALHKLGIEVKVVGCNPRESRLALGSFARVVFEGILNGKRVAYAEASMTRVGSPIMRWLLAVTDSKIFFVPPREWADPFFTFVLDLKVSVTLGRILDLLGRVEELSEESSNSKESPRERYVREIERVLSEALCKYLSDEFPETIREEVGRELNRSKSEEYKRIVNSLEDELRKLRSEIVEGKKVEKLMKNRVEFNRRLEARDGEKVEEIPILVMRTILPKDGRIAVNNPLLVLRALYDLTEGGKVRISINEFAKKMSEKLEMKARNESSRGKKIEDAKLLVSYQKLRPVLDMLDGKFLVRRPEGRRILLELNEFGKELAAAIPDKIYEMVRIDRAK